MLTRFIVTTLVRVNTARDTVKVREMLLHDVDQTSLESFFRSIGDLRRTDLTTDLSKVTAPILGVYGAHDNIVNPKQVDVLSRTVPASQTVVLNQSRHFPMLYEPELFNAAVRQFLAG
jgi:pimeloyl-ACP methyl ester carboxylesterase